MTDFFLPAPQQRQQNWFAPIAGGIEAGGRMADQAAQRNWFNTQQQEHQEQRGALKQGAETGDYKALRGVNPQLAMQIEDHIAKTPPPELMKINVALEAGEPMRGLVTPDNYGDYKSLLERNGLPPNYLPPPDQVKQNPALLQRVLYAGDIFKASLKQYDPKFQLDKYKVENVDVPKAQAYVKKSETDSGYKIARLGQFERGLELHGVSVDETKRHHAILEGKTGKEVDYYNQAYKNVAKTDAYKDEKDPDKRVQMVENEFTIINKSRSRVGAGGQQLKVGGGGTAAGKTLVGQTPDGKMVYQDSQGNKFVAE